MKLLGVVQWITRDKAGHPIAGVRPIVELQKSEWRPINQLEEFPSQGQAFWFDAQFASEGGLIVFNAATNPGQKDQFRVVEPKPAHEVLDLRRVGGASDVRDALVNGIRVQGGSAGTIRALIWTKDLLIGPIELTRLPNGTAKLNGGNLARLPSFTPDAVQLRSIDVDNQTRWLRIDEGAPSGYVDWDDNRTVLRRALEVAVKLAKQAGRNTGQTKKQIEDAANALAEVGIGADAQLDRYRLERALTLLANTELVSRSASELADLLLQHPAIKASLDGLTMKVRSEVEQKARDDLDKQLERERAVLKETTEAVTRARSELEAGQQELRNVQEQVAEVQSRVARVSEEAKAAVDARLLAALDRPMELLAEISVLRPFLGGNGSRTPREVTRQNASALQWPAMRGETAGDKASLRRVLTSSARAQGVDPAVMLQIHAAMMARLMPVTLGPSALAALLAYAHGGCGGRTLIIHVSPAAIHPHEFDDGPAGGLTSAAEGGREVDGLSIVILEGANRSPLEASVVPLLQLAEAGLSTFSSSPGVRVGASLVAGATTVPVTPQLWSYAAAIYAETEVRSVQTAAVGDIPLSSEMFALGDEPKGVVDELLDIWPDCRELRPAMSRFGSGLTRLYSDEERIAELLLHSLVLPYVVTGLTDEEQAEALGKVQDPEGAVVSALRRLRRSLA